MCLAHSNVAQSSWTESWTTVSGATGYNVYINNTKVTSSPVKGTNYTVTGEMANTTYSVTVTAVNAGGESAQSAADTITTLAPPLSIATNWVWDAQYGVPFNALQLEAASGHGPYTWTLMQGALPVGLTLSADGIIRGIPTGPDGSNTFTVQVKDATGTTASKSLSIQV